MVLSWQGIQQGGEESSAAVREDKHPLARPAVHQRAGERAEKDGGKEADGGGGGQRRGRAGGLGQPPDEGELHESAAYQRERLACPDRKEPGLPS